MAISSPPRPSGQAAPHSQRGLITVLVLGLVALLVLVLALAALLARGGPPASGAQGSGVAATQSRALAAFSSLDLPGSNNVTVVIGGRQSVVVHADSNLLGNVTTRVVAGTLIIDTTGSFSTKSPMSVEITVPSLIAVTLSGNGQISVTGISAPQLTVSLPGTGTICTSFSRAVVSPPSKG